MKYLLLIALFAFACQDETEKETKVVFKDVAVDAGVSDVDTDIDAGTQVPPEEGLIIEGCSINGKDYSGFDYICAENKQTGTFTALTHCVNGEWTTNIECPEGETCVLQGTNLVCGTEQILVMSKQTPYLIYS